MDTVSTPDHGRTADVPPNGNSYPEVPKPSAASRLRNSSFHRLPLTASPATVGDWASNDPLSRFAAVTVAKAPVVWLALRHSSRIWAVEVLSKKSSRSG